MPSYHFYTLVVILDIAYFFGRTYAVMLKAVWKGPSSYPHIAPIAGLSKISLSSGVYFIHHHSITHHANKCNTFTS